MADAQQPIIDDLTKHRVVQDMAFGLRLTALVGLLIGATIEAIAGLRVALLVAAVGLAIILALYVKADRNARAYKRQRSAAIATKGRSVTDPRKGPS